MTQPSVQASGETLVTGQMALGRKVLVIGGSGNIGQSICRLLESEGAEIAFTYYKNKHMAEQIAEGMGKCYVMRCDTREIAQLTECVAETKEKLGGLDAVILASGLCGEPEVYQAIANREAATITGITYEQVRGMWEAHSLSAFNTCKAAAQALSDAGGSIVLLGSMVCSKAVATPIHFSMSKTALNGLVQACAKDIGSLNIRVNIIAPGLVEGGASRAVADELKHSYEKYCALKRLAKPQEVAQLAMWLALHNTYVTGQCILLDGGL